MKYKLLTAFAIASVVTGCSSKPSTEDAVPTDNRTEQERFTDNKIIFDLNDELALYEKLDVEYTHRDYDEQVINLYIKDKIENPVWVKFKIDGNRMPVGIASIPLSNKELSKLGVLEGEYKNTLIMGFDPFRVRDGKIERLNIFEHLYFDTHFNVDSETFLKRNRLIESTVEFPHDGSGTYEVYGKVGFYKYNPETNKTWLVVDDDVRIFKDENDVGYKISKQHYWQ